MLIPLMEIYSPKNIMNWLNQWQSSSYKKCVQLVDYRDYIGHSKKRDIEWQHIIKTYFKFINGDSLALVFEKGTFNLNTFYATNHS